MRTKTLLLTAALSAAGIATSMAQTPVYSVNAVGYVNTPLVKGFNMISNPLNNTAPNGNVVSNLFAALPGGSQVFVFNGKGFDLADVDALGGGIAGPGAGKEVPPGNGVFVNVEANTTFTFVGEVPQGTLHNPVPTGFSIKGSQVPQSGTVVALGYPGTEGDQIFQFDELTQKYKPVIGFNLGAWDADVTLEVGDAVFINNPGAAKDWTRTFSVNQ
jgi:hypothetical protein